jgi:hypothetical protein
MRARVSKLRFCWPCSMRATALWLVPSERASSDCVSPLCRRASRINEPIRSRYVSVTDMPATLSQI